MLERYRPQKPIRHYCKQCKIATIDSTKVETGGFYLVYGNGADMEKRDFSGKFQGVMIAICTQCKKELFEYAGNFFN